MYLPLAGRGGVVKTCKPRDPRSAPPAGRHLLDSTRGLAYCCCRRSTPGEGWSHSKETNKEVCMYAECASWEKSRGSKAERIQKGTLALTMGVLLVFFWGLARI